MADRKTWTQVEIIARLQSDPRWVRRALLALFGRQTEDERRVGQTIYLNGRGFSGYDARAGTCYARKFRDGGRLTSGQWNSARRIAIKYSGQLREIANNRAVGDM